MTNNQKLNLWHNSKTQIVSLKTLKTCDQIKNSNFDKTKKKIVRKLKKNSNCDKTQKLKLWQNSKNQIVTELKKSNCDSSKSDSSDSSSSDSGNSDIF